MRIVHRTIPPFSGNHQAVPRGITAIHPEPIALRVVIAASARGDEERAGAVPSTVVQQPQALTVITPHGFCVEELDATSVVALVRALG